MKTTARAYLISGLLVLLIIVASITIGSVFIPPQVIFKYLTDGLLGRNVEMDSSQPYGTILFVLRLPRTALIGLAGAALAGSGAAYQGLFRNPLADPYLIGVASGAGLGAVIAMNMRSMYSPGGLMIVPLCAFVAALLTVLLVYQLARVGKTVPTSNLLLAGVAVSSFTTALTSFLMITAQGELRRVLSWMLGGSALSGWQPVIAMLPYVLLGLGVLLIMGNALNVMQFGDEQAQQLGIPVNRVRILVVVGASMTTAAAVSFAGIIGFVGLIVPHLMRLLWGGDYRRLIGLSILNGASLLLVADILARVVMIPQEIPVGIITALAGAPFFLWILHQAKQQNYW